MKVDETLVRCVLCRRFFHIFVPSREDYGDAFGTKEEYRDNEINFKCQICEPQKTLGEF